LRFHYLENALVFEWSVSGYIRNATADETPLRRVLFHDHTVMITIFKAKMIADNPFVESMYADKKGKRLHLRALWIIHC